MNVADDETPHSEHPKLVAEAVQFEAQDSWNEIKLTPARNSVNRFAVTVRDIYSNRIFVAGFVCLVMGLGNWAVGATESNRLQNILHKTAQTGLEDSYRNFRELDHQKNQEVLRRINADREKHNSARVKLNFYYVVAAGGKLLCVIGAALTLASMVGVIRRDSDLKIKKLSIPTRKE